MSGINRATRSLKTFSESRITLGIKCVFLSHQQKDKELCKKIADYLMAADIDVYFDEYDSDLKFHRQSNNPSGVVQSIKNGINASSHMLVVVSPNTINSSWVPWEIGYGYDKTHLSILTLKGLTQNSLPDYLKTSNIIRGTKSLNGYLANITNTLQSLMEGKSLIKLHSTPSHPLDSYLDWEL